MRSSTGLYVSRLDHVRAAAVFLVYCWHFVHVHVPFEAVPDFFFLSLIEEGYAGVALFMTLSGYLFAKIMDGRSIDLAPFYRNRFLRLVPLLAVVLAYWSLRGFMTLDGFFLGLLSFPTWPPGTWSVVVELHFYAIFPVLLVMQRRHRIWPLVALMVLSLVLRFALWKALGEVQYISYWTIAGCIDFFAAGMLWHELAGQRWTNRRPALLFAVVLIGFAAIWHAFNIAGGFYNLGGYPSPSPVWIVLPAIQGLAFGALIVSYEKLTFTMPGWLDRGLAKIGEVSYSIYLVHFIVVRTFAKMCGHLGLDMSNFTLSLIFAIATFPLVVALSLATYELIEKPFLKMRGKYVGRPSASAGPASAGARLVQA